MSNDIFFLYFTLVILWATFYSSHSFLASLKVKRFLGERLGKRMKWYRLTYSLFYLIFFLGILWFSARIPYRQLIPTSPWTSYVGYMLATFGTIILVRSSKEISLSRFFGMKEDTPSPSELVVRGIYGKIRHPLYAGILLLFLGYLFISPSLVVLTHALCLLIYLPIGIYFEEKNLHAIFGSSYEEYQKRVPALFPKLGA
ncbi:methyltransferase family protein [Algoriphagus namhaensis]